MSIVTLCPQCKTAFAIQAEHYSAADAWVRCGRCAHVFEVDQHLFEIDPIDNEPALPLEEASAPEPAPIIVAAPMALSAPVWQAPKQASDFWPLALTVIAALALVAQVLLFQRHKLVAMNPSVSPVFNAMCQKLGCRVEWPQETDKVAIESTQFKQLGVAQFSFTLSVKNQAPYFLAMPALELTLTHEEEGDVVRKVWFAQDMGLPEVLKPLRTQTIEMEFVVEEPWAGKIKGYRALLFYP